MAQTSVTPQMQMFADLVKSGERPKEAYKQAYAVSTLTDKQITQKAQQLLQNPKIYNYIHADKVLQEELISWDKRKDIAEVRKILWNRLQFCFKNGDDNAILRYADQLNKINGAYADNADTGNTVSPLSGLSVGEIKAIISLDTSEKSST